jgi:hypothetical protein
LDQWIHALQCSADVVPNIHPFLLQRCANVFLRLGLSCAVDSHPMGTLATLETVAKTCGMGSCLTTFKISLNLCLLISKIHASVVIFHFQ